MQVVEASLDGTRQIGKEPKRCMTNQGESVKARRDKTRDDVVPEARRL